MDDLLIIILTLIFAAVGIFGQSKKRKAQQENQPVPQPEEPDSFWDFLKKEAPKPRQPKGETQPEQTYRQQQLETEKETPEPVQKIQPSKKDTSIYSTELTGKNDVTKQQKSKSKIGFSLRKAVIYSEILNRKYT
jgi:FtsZ-interacting cell division protein ZipA